MVAKTSKNCVQAEAKEKQNKSDAVDQQILFLRVGKRQLSIWQLSVKLGTNAAVVDVISKLIMEVVTDKKKKKMQLIKFYFLRTKASQEVQLYTRGQVIEVSKCF